MPAFVYILFRDVKNKKTFGEMRKFEGAHQAAAAKGYPDVLTYLYATNQVYGWCEVVPHEEAMMHEQAKAARLKCLTMAKR